ncbi:dienelactone hydrolase family protein [Bradyrhizobium agreste]|uniref:dienelactone hydrolase family protein n=1 Tax=Bradyrhizobium agreste TaxID=2751811 RepID=UPI001FE7B514|nr:dienelactone hydrolase family protein [Bradyrhizobium agreste]
MPFGRPQSRRHLIRSLVGLTATWLSVASATAAPQTVSFRSADARTVLVGYLFQPATPGPWPAIVMLHGRGGPYSSNVNAACTTVDARSTSPCNAATLSKRHRMWGEYWAAHGYLALLPDSFGPRGKAHGFGRFTHGDPDRADVNEMTVRPLDAEGALAYLRGRNDVIGRQIFLQGWSNGGSTALNIVIRQGDKTNGYRGSLVFYPGCGPAALLAPIVSTATPIAMFLGADDEEVSPANCQRLAERSRQAGSRIDLTVYPGASHGFDEPSSKRQSLPENRAAMNDALVKAAADLERWKN